MGRRQRGCGSVLWVQCNFAFNVTATTELYTLSLHDAPPIFRFPSISPQVCVSGVDFHHSCTNMTTIANTR